MTSRLKRKLGDLGVDTSSRKANENFCLIGTPLPPLEKSKDTGEFVPLWKQEVRDEKGRRRLHGAFTGGFSAGYFNTVGSKEGWTPQSFVSSRNDRAKKKDMRAEDFMDEEDLQDIKDSRNLVDTTEQMDFGGGTTTALLGTEVDDVEKDPITRTLEASLLPAPKDSVGAKILKKMGWRLGQGIGPRISLKQRKEQDALAYEPTTGSKLTVGALDIPEDDDEAGKHTYAPRDTPILIVKRKDNAHGLGYRPGLTLNESLGGNAGGSQGPQLAGGFGLGALNDADEDDLDVYDNTQHARRRLAYDSLEGEDSDMVVIGGKSDRRTASMVPSTSSQYFRDGRPVLAGFVLSDEPVAEDRWFPLPEIPPEWTPNPNRVWEKDKENAPVQRSPPEALPHGKWKRSNISADQRGAMLGETPLPSGPRSIFDYMSQKDKERIQRIASNLGTGTDSTSSGQGPGPSVPHPSVSIAKLEPHVAQAALRGFQPFAADPAKQARYTAYLHSQADSDGFAPIKPVEGQSTDDFNKELEHYAKAASLFKPMSGAMAGRFTSAAVVEFGPKVQEGLYTPSQEELAAKEAQRKKEEEEKVTPKAHAAKMGMYGPMTRETKPWQPVKLLCKRFGVKDPDITPEIPTEAEVASFGSQPGPSFSHGQAETGASTSTGRDVTVPVQTRNSPRDLANIGLGDDETQGQDTLTYQRPSMDIFKAIFASDDEDSDDEETEKNAEDEHAADTFKPTFIPREGKSKKSKDEDRSKEKKEKKKKGKKGVLVSFEVEEEGGDGVELKQPKDRPKKKRKGKEGGSDGKDQGMWTDKPPPDVPTVVPSSPASTDVVTDAPSRGRKRAIDFM
ncbi:unnamed protein product [Cyclocybe aegerita]|uniref:G-patch domain-containing protein n=1 Tax=Cyclocybe aegerita TaxID=1973307 RepID=A0A8S0W3X6_CYCAE|nr:unnamed protein product [Cyclocybe aegerita]